MTRAEHPSTHVPDDTADTSIAAGRHDRRAMLGKLALGGAGAAVGAGLLSKTVAAQTPTPGGLTFFPIDPQRAYDSRQPNYAVRGVLARNSNRVVSVANGHDSSGTVTLENIVPADASAVHINLTATAMTAGNYLAVTAGSVQSTATSVVNWPDDATQVANAITVPIDADRQVRVFCGDQVGSTHFIVDVFGFYLPEGSPAPTPPTPPTTSTTTTTTTTTTTVAP